MWVRGLKLTLLYLNTTNSVSHPMWVRGLKPNSQFGAVSSVRRTPCGCVD